MNMRGYKSAVLSGLVMVAIVAFAAQDGAVLRRELKVGATDSYSFSFKTNQSVVMEGGPAAGQEMPVDMGMTMKMAFKVGAFDDKEKKADLDIDVTDINLDMGAMGGMMGGAGGQMPKEMKIAAKLDERNRLSGFKMPKMGMASMMMGGGAGTTMGPLFIEFPEGPVKIGDTWQMKMQPIPLVKDKESAFTVTLLGEKELDAKKVYTIGLKGSIAMDGDVAEMIKDNPEMANSPVAGMKMLMKGTVDFVGEGLVDKASGRTLKMDMTMKSKQKMDMPDMGMQVAVSGTSTVKMALIPPKP